MLGLDSGPQLWLVALDLQYVVVPAGHNRGSRFFGHAVRRAQALAITGYPVAGDGLGVEAPAKSVREHLIIKLLQYISHAHMRGQAVSQGAVVVEKGGITTAARTDFTVAHVAAGRGQEDESKQGDQRVTLVLPTMRVGDLRKEIS